ncbi:MAG: DinB family protein [Planctomycetes bacterium]|jgi:hypothetical protein|nr:DinB family protein [Planctomycetota bacterium]
MDIKAALKGQYHAALAMLRAAVERCPDELWLSERHVNRTWRVAYHAVFYGHLYLMPSEADFAPWEGHREESQFLGRLPWPPHDLPKSGEPYARADVLRYLGRVDALVDPTLDRMDLGSADSGFWWYRMPKLDHLLLSVRHVQHHAGQLAERLRVEADVGLDWRA